MYCMQQSPTEVLRAELEAWRKEKDWSREALTQVVIEQHVAIKADVVTGIRFQKTDDVYGNMRTNSVRVFRWLSGDVTYPALPADMVPTLLAALPMPRRLRAAMALLGDSVGLSVTPIVKRDRKLAPLTLLADTQRESAEAVQALVSMATTLTPESVREARAEVVEAEAALGHTRQELDTILATFNQQAA